ncbi:MAG: hypothetical protein FJ128_06320 [Deltaproteobacteria bacterium]|nr:hypothetical protein [Deltaproteobacteria bacterium]
MTLQHFEAGWGWDAQVRQYVRKKYRRDLAGLAHLDPRLLARLLKGEVLEERPYATVLWVIRIVPFRPLELFWLFDADPEFGVDLRVLFARKSLAVPTEDAYVFAWDYLALLARYGRGAFPLEEAAPDPEWIRFEDFAPPDAAPVKETAMKLRDELLHLLSADLVAVAVARLDCGRAAALPDGWEAAFPLLGDLAMRLRLHDGAVDLAFDRHGARKYPPEFLLSFAWLYVNALIRECRGLDPSLPRLSRYF